MDDKNYFDNSRYVKELKPQDFDSEKPWQLKKTDDCSCMMLYYASWCPHCKDLAPTYEAAAKLSGLCDFYAFNCAKHTQHVNKIKEDMPALIRSYPTIIIYRKGIPAEQFQEERTKEKLLEACMKNCSKK
jgi:thiol-disulfide isomerase/thioredoxin